MYYAHTYHFLPWSCTDFVLNILHITWLSKEGYTAVVHSFARTQILNDCTNTEYWVDLFLKQCTNLPLRALQSVHNDTLKPGEKKFQKPRREKTRNLRENHRGWIPLPRMGRCAINVISEEYIQFTVITVYGHQNINTESRSMLVKSIVQEQDTGQGHDSRPLWLSLGPN